MLQARIPQNFQICLMTDALTQQPRQTKLGKWEGIGFLLKIIQSKSYPKETLQLEHL